MGAETGGPGRGASADGIAAPVGRGGAPDSRRLADQQQAGGGLRPGRVSHLRRPRRRAAASGTSTATSTWTSSAPWGRSASATATRRWTTPSGSSWGGGSSPACCGRWRWRWPGACWRPSPAGRGHPRAVRFFKGGGEATAGRRAHRPRPHRAPRDPQRRLPGLAGHLGGRARPGGAGRAGRLRAPLPARRPGSSCAALLEANAGKVAAVFMDLPYSGPLPDGHLAAVRDLAHAHGAVFATDEIVSGFRLAVGGGAAYSGVRARSGRLRQGDGQRDAPGGRRRPGGGDGRRASAA